MGRHLSRLVLIRLFTDPAPGPAEEAVRHLEHCPRCSARAAGVVAELKRTGALVRSADARNGVLILLEDSEAKGHDWLQARAAWVELKALSPQQQLGRLRAAPELLTAQMFTTIVEDAAGTAPEDPHLGEEIALVAHALAGMLPEPRYPPRSSTTSRAKPWRPPATAAGCRGAGEARRKPLPGRAAISSRAWVIRCGRHASSRFRRPSPRTRATWSKLWICWNALPRSTMKRKISKQSYLSRFSPPVL